MLASLGFTGRNAIASCLDYSDETYLVLEKGKCIAIFGVTYPINTTQAIPWAIGADEVRKYSKQLTEVAIEFLNSCNGSLLCNMVDSRNKVAIRWLKKLGFKFQKGSFQHYDRTVPFKYFYKENNRLNNV